MSMMMQRKTHPMVLTAAVAVTIFSILGSAAITGMIPSAHSGRIESDATSGMHDTGVQRDSNQEQSLHVADSDSRKSASGAASEKPVLRQPAANAGEHGVPCKACGVIESIRSVEQEGDGSGLGAVAGGVAGGVLGNQVGKGKGNTLMTLLGIGGGAYAGHTIEKNMKSSTVYVLKVRMEDGSHRSVTQRSQPEFAVGDHVRVANGHLTSA